MSQKSILFLCGQYASSEHANSICVKNMAEQFVAEGHTVHVIAKKSKKTDPVFSTENGVDVIRIKESFLNRFDKTVAKRKGVFAKIIYRIVHTMRYMYTFFLYPNVAPSTSRLMCRIAKQQINEHQIDMIIATYRPYESIKSAIWLKKEYGNSLWVVTYHLDLIDSPNNKSSVIVGIKKNKNIKAIAKEIKTVDRILLPNSAPKIEDDKVRYVDFPMYVKPKGIESALSIAPFAPDEIAIAYVGSLDSCNRNPEKAISLIKRIGPINGKRVVLHIWGKLTGPSTEQLVCQSRMDTIIYHGMVEPKMVPEILEQADFLLNIGNKVTYTMVPSKIFQYFASTKPIIYTISHLDDRSIDYFRRYGYGFEVYEAEIGKNDNNLLLKLHDFIIEHYGVGEFAPLDSFEKCTPEYICSQCLPEIREDKV